MWATTEKVSELHFHPLNTLLMARCVALAKLVTFDIILGVLYILVFAIEAFGIASAWLVIDCLTSRTVWTLLLMLALHVL